MKRFFLSSLILIPIFLFSQIVNVPGDYTTIQEAIDAANTGDTVLVQQGSYAGGIMWVGKDLVVASNYIFTNDSNDIYQTVIVGDTMVFGIHLEGLNPSAKLTGFTIQNAFFPDQNGGGIRVNNGSPTLISLIIKNNTASRGGGVIAINSTLFLFSSTVKANHANDRGGGIQTFNSSIAIDSTILINNTADIAGAMYSSYGGNEAVQYSAIISASAFDYNSGGNTSGLYFRRNGFNSIINLDISDCSFSYNAHNANGALYVRGDSIDFQVINSRFIGNIAETFTGAAAFIAGCAGELINCVIADNVGGNDGGYWNAGGFTAWGSTELYLYNCTFSDNQAPYGGALTAGPQSEVFATHCIFWDNPYTQIAIIDMDDMGGTAAFDYCDMQYGMDSIRVDPNSQLLWGDHNITGDPHFIYSGNDPYALSEGSPCIDGGVEDTAGMTYIAYDILGNVRIWDGDGNGSAIIDLGAYEFDAPIYVGLQEQTNLYSREGIFTSIYPNPCTEVLKVQYKLESEIETYLRLYSVCGVLVYEGLIRKNHNGASVISTAGLSPGLYLLRIYNEKHSDQAKIIVQ